MVDPGAEQALPVDAGAGALTRDQVLGVLAHLPLADSVELKATVPSPSRRSVVEALDLDVMRAELRQVTFFDTPALAAYAAGVVVRVRRRQGRGGDSVVKLRPLPPSALVDPARKLRGFGIEVDAMPGGFVCSASLKADVADARARSVCRGKRPPRRAFSRDQRDLYARYGPQGVGLDDLVPLGPVTVLKLKFSPRALSRSLVAELWAYPSGEQVLELSAKCDPGEAFVVADELRSFLSARGVDLGAPQATKTRTALEHFARAADGANGP
ncbi:hypothetical protein [Demequina sp. NBRC 110056]|uniref:hypothetical protein n=1 Tax=Demequina sp. NBRC 110056 TaxID=1570345 RepID=UPI0009FE0244|nr:hypothetical protein [Demequina sp. NBRC 110056]